MHAIVEELMIMCRSVSDYVCYGIALMGLVHEHYGVKQFQHYLLTLLISNFSINISDLSMI